MQAFSTAQSPNECAGFTLRPEILDPLTGQLLARNNKTGASVFDLDGALLAMADSLIENGELKEAAALIESLANSTYLSRNISRKQLWQKLQLLYERLGWRASARFAAEQSFWNQ